MSSSFCALTLVLAVASARCIDMNIPVTATATNKLILAPDFDLTSVSGVTAFLGSGAGVFQQAFGDSQQGGTFPISARYCPPAENPNAPPDRKKTLQLLYHGIPYNKNYWEATTYPGEPSRYSWVEVANSRGYPTLAVDGLGNGNSTVHPDPILTVQQPLETEIIHQLIALLRAGKVKGVPKAEKVVYVGHSYASVLGNAVMTQYPKDFNAAILTGYSYTIDQAVPGVLLALLAPASVYNPQRYGDLPPGYITFDSQHGKRQSYYAATGQFSPSVAAHDFENQGVTTIGEIITFFSGLEEAKGFTGDILVLTGQNDALFCSDGSRTTDPNPSCGVGKNSIPAKSGQFYPNANFHYYMPPGTSHATNLHYSSDLVFQHAHEFLRQSGY